MWLGNNNWAIFSFSPKCATGPTSSVIVFLLNQIVLSLNDARLDIWHFYFPGWISRMPGIGFEPKMLLRQTSGIPFHFKRVTRANREYTPPLPSSSYSYVYSSKDILRLPTPTRTIFVSVQNYVIFLISWVSRNSRKINIVFCESNVFFKHELFGKKKNVFF